MGRLLCSEPLYKIISKQISPQTRALVQTLAQLCGLPYSPWWAVPVLLFRVLCREGVIRISSASASSSKKVARVHPCLIPSRGR